MINFNKYICVILIPTFLLHSCTFTYKKTKAADIDTYYEKINSYSEKYRTYITLISEEEYRVEDLMVQRDSSTFTGWI